MASTHGKGGVVKLGASPGVNTVLEVKGFTFNSSVDIADTTVMGAAAKTHAPGIPEWDGTVECNWDEADTNGQVTLDEGASVIVNLFFAGAATGKKYLTGTATITKTGTEAKVDGIVSRSFDFKGNGAYSWATAP